MDGRNAPPLQGYCVAPPTLSNSRHVPLSNRLYKELERRRWRGSGGEFRLTWAKLNRRRPRSGHRRLKVKDHSRSEHSPEPDRALMLGSKRPALCRFKAGVGTEVMGW